MRAVALQELELEQQTPAEPLIPFDVADVGLRRPQIGVEDVGEGDRRAERRAVGANRETVRGSNDGNASTLSGVRCTNLPKPPRRIARPSGSHANRHAGPRRPVDALHDRRRDRGAGRARTSPASRRASGPARTRANSTPLTSCAVRSAEHGQLGERSVEPADLDRPAGAEAVEAATAAGRCRT